MVVAVERRRHAGAGLSVHDAVRALVNRAICRSTFSVLHPATRNLSTISSIWVGAKGSAADPDFKGDLISEMR
jgi:hypothetical protein